MREKIDITRLEKPYFTNFWGRKKLVRPKFVEEILGDGLQLLSVTPLNTRPQHYYIRVDSRWDTSNEGEGETVADHLDEILDAIEDQYDSCEEQWKPWPALNWDGGSWMSVCPEQAKVTNEHKTTTQQEANHAAPGQHNPLPVIARES